MPGAMPGAMSMGLGSSMMQTQANMEVERMLQTQALGIVNAARQDQQPSASSTSKSEEKEEEKEEDLEAMIKESNRQQDELQRQREAGQRKPKD